MAEQTAPVWLSLMLRVSKIQRQLISKAMTVGKRSQVSNAMGCGHSRVTSCISANVTDREEAIDMFTHAKEQLVLVKKALVDGGYTAELFAKQIK